MFKIYEQNKNANLGIGKKVHYRKRNAFVSNQQSFLDLFCIAIVHLLFCLMITLFFIRTSTF